MISYLWQYIPTHLHAEINKVSISQYLEDQLIYTPTKNGRFSTPNFFLMTSFCGVKRRWSDWVWNAILPPNISAFLWKLVRHALPVDCQIRSKGIIVASRCRCCVNPSEESINHLFIQTDIAKEVWQRFGNIFRIPHVWRDVLLRLNAVCVALGLLRICFEKFGLRGVGLLMMRSPWMRGRYVWKLFTRYSCWI